MARKKADPTPLQVAMLFDDAEPAIRQAPAPEPEAPSLEAAAELPEETAPEPVSRAHAPATEPEAAPGEQEASRPVEKPENGDRDLFRLFRFAAALAAEGAAFGGEPEPEPCPETPEGEELRGGPFRLSAEDAERRAWQAGNLAQARSQFAAFPLKKADPSVKREPSHGWLLPYLLDADLLYLGRWEYWCRLVLDGRLTPEQGPIPRIHFEQRPHGQTQKMIEQCLDAIPGYGSWRGAWSSSTHFDYFLDWLCYAVGYVGQKELPQEPRGCEGASDRLYQIFQGVALLLWPYDYFGDLMAESGFGKGNGFYPTPLNLVDLISGLTMPGDRDVRDESVNDPCTGTGRFLLSASNYSLRLFGQDVSLQCVKASVVNAAFYAPWLFKPIPFLYEKREEPEPSEEEARRRANTVSY